MKMGKKILASLLAVLTVGASICFSAGCTGNVDQLVAEQIALLNKQKADALLSSKVRLSCDENGEFNIVVLADVHAGGPIAEENKNNFRNLIDEEDPDLVIFTGDNTHSADEASLRATLDSIVGYIEEKQIPWCHVYGNHDHESGMSKEELQVVYESYDYCVSKAGDPNLTGVGNYVLPIYEYNSDKINSLVWCLDSGHYLSSEDKAALIPQIDNDFSGWDGLEYDYIHADQVNWYYQTSLFFEEYFNDIIPSIMAFHIPLQESYNAWRNRKAFDNWTGEKRDPVGASQINSGLFTAVADRGDVLAIVNGHDHLNDYMVEYSGVKLCYSPGSSTHGYHETDMLGSRVFKMNTNDRYNIETYVHYFNR
ncbi:MAG: hypothetical protein E7370_04970 [Clostridiales bacterium]|nr:hypothetical protein [Clostridiales bacterium]